MPFLNKKTSRIFIILFLLSFSILAGAGYTDGVLGANRVSRFNNDFLQDTFNKALNGFMVLSGIKMVVSIIEGSDIGVGFNLEIGDVAQPAYDYVDIAWRTVLTGSVVLLMTRYLLEVSALLDHWTLSLALFFILAMLFFKWYFPERRRIFKLARGMALFMTIGALALYIILPLSIAGGSYLSHRITAPSLRKAEAELEAVRNRLFEENGESNTHTETNEMGPESGVPIFKKKIEKSRTVEDAAKELNEVRKELLPDNIKERGDLISRVKAWKDRVGFITGYLTESARDITVWVVRLIAGYIFDCIVFPYALLLILFWFFKSMAVYVFGFAQQQTLRDELGSLLRKYYRLPEEARINEAENQ